MGSDWKKRAEPVNEASDWKKRATSLHEDGSEFDQSQLLDDNSGVIKQMKEWGEGAPSAEEMTGHLPLLGGMVGALGGPVTAGLGAATGKAAENAIEQYFFNQPKTSKELYVDPALEGLYSATGEVAAPYLVKGISKGAELAGSGLKNVTSSLSKIPKKAIEVFSSRPEEVKAIGKLSEETGLQDAADMLRREAQASIVDKKNNINDEIGYLLKDKNGLIDVTKIKQIGNNALKKLDPALTKHQQAAEEIKDYLRQLEEMQIHPDLPYVETSRLQNMKQALQDAADYDKASNPLAKRDIQHWTFQQMSSQARNDIGKAIPELVPLNKDLMQLHSINKNINKNLLKPESTAASVMAVGSGENQQALKQMRKLEKITNFPYVKEAENIAAARYFNNAGLLPMEKTGASLVPILFGGQQAVSNLMQGNLGSAAASAGLAGLGSPLAIKSAINAKNAISNFVKPYNPVGTATQMIARAIQAGMPSLQIYEQLTNTPLLTPTEKAKLKKTLPTQ